MSIENTLGKCSILLPSMRIFFIFKNSQVCILCWQMLEWLIQDRHFLVSHFLGCDTHLPMWMRTLVHCPHGTCEATEIDINMKLMMLAVFWVLSLTSECAVFFNPPFFKLWRIYLFSCMYSKIPDSLYFSSNVVCYSLYISSLQSLAISSFLSYFCSI